MAERTQKSKGTTGRDGDTAAEAAPAVTETGEKLKADLVEEIVELETNAEDFVKSYVQKGGQ